nr:MAG TPA: hypothetical protein [Caudoviricetes sp.]
MLVRLKLLIVSHNTKEYNLDSHNTLRIKLWQTSLLLMI